LLAGGSIGGSFLRLTTASSSFPARCSEYNRDQRGLVRHKKGTAETVPFASEIPEKRLLWNRWQRARGLRHLALHRFVDGDVVRIERSADRLVQLDPGFGVGALRRHLVRASHRQIALVLDH